MTTKKECEHRDGWVVLEDGSEAIDDNSRAFLSLQCNSLNCDFTMCVWVFTTFCKEVSEVTRRGF